MRKRWLLFLSLALIAWICRPSEFWKIRFKSQLLFRSPPTWMLHQINADLSTAPSENFAPFQLDQALVKIGPHRGFGRYRVKQNRLDATLHHPYSKEIIMRFDAVTQSIRTLLSLSSLPDVDFLVCLEDECDRANLPASVFAFAKDSSLQEPVLLMPDWEVLEGNERFLRGVNKGLKSFPWEKRMAQAFWRGGMTGGHFTMENFLTLDRPRLVALSLSHPSSINAKFSMTGSQCSEPEKLIKSFHDYLDKPTSIRGHLHYKYQILIDGNTCAYTRAYWQLFSQSLILKQASPHIQWYYGALIPGVHYLPVRSDFSDLVEKVEWAQTHDKEAEVIAKNARQFALNRLTKADVYLYFYLLIKEYARKQASL